MEDDSEVNGEGASKFKHSKRAGKYWNALGIFLTLALAVLMVGGLIITFNQRRTSTGLYRRDYEGRIMEKFLIPHDSRTGSSAERAFRLKGRNEEQSQVVVGLDTYERAEVGMWIKSSKAGIELSWP